MTTFFFSFDAIFNISRVQSGTVKSIIMSDFLKAFSGSCSEIYMENAFKKSVYNQKDRLDNAKELGETSLAFFVHQTISKKEMDYYAENIQNVIKKATK